MVLCGCSVQMRTQNVSRTLLSVWLCQSLSVEDFIGSVAALVKADKQWFQHATTTRFTCVHLCLHLNLSWVRKAKEVEYCVIASPSGPYFPQGVKPVNIWVEDTYFRTGPGGTGFAKCGGNYSASLVGEYRGIAQGCEQVCFVDAATKTYLEELGGMNMFAVHKDGHLETLA